MYSKIKCILNHYEIQISSLNTGKIECFPPHFQNRGYNLTSQSNLCSYTGTIKKYVPLVYLPTDIRTGGRSQIHHDSQSKFSKQHQNHRMKNLTGTSFTLVQHKISVQPPIPRTIWHEILYLKISGFPQFNFSPYCTGTP